jgi:L-ascorbate metabolism protein UlaG (beta-lactamase superfamily)
MIELGGIRLLTDPVVGGRVGFLRRIAPPPAPDAARAVDAVLLSHCHADHLDLHSLRSLGAEVRVVAPPRAVSWLRRRGFQCAEPVTAGAKVRVGAVEIEVTPARHDGRRWPVGDPAQAVGFLAGGIYFAGDTDLFPEMESLTGRVDVALLPIAGWGPTLGPGHLDPSRAAQAAAIIRPRIAIPIHWGTFGPFWSGASAARAQRASVDSFVAEAARIAPDVEVRVLAPLAQTEWCRHPDRAHVSAVARPGHGGDDRSDG